MKKTREEYAKEQNEAYSILRIPKKLHREFKAHCASKGIKMNWQAEQLIKEYLERMNK